MSILHHLCSFGKVIASSDQWRLLAASMSYFQLGGAYRWNLYEAYLYDTDDASGARLSVLSTAESTKYSDLYPGSNTQDGNTATRWNTLVGTTIPEWISFTFAEAVQLRSMVLDIYAQPGSSYGMVGPASIAVQYYLAGAWHTLIEVSVANEIAVAHAIRTFTNLQ